MGKISVNFANVESKVEELDNYTQQNIISKVELEYVKLQQLLKEAGGTFNVEMIVALETEKQGVLDFANYMRNIYMLVQTSSAEFETVDKQHARKLEKKDLSKNKKREDIGKDRKYDIKSSYGSKSESGSRTGEKNRDYEKNL